MNLNERARVRVDANGLVLASVATIVLLAVAHAVFQWLRFERGLPEVYGLVRLFDLAAEANLPSFFSSVQIVVCGVLAAAIGLARRAAKDAYATHWLVLGAMLFALAVDEAAEIHELTIRPVRELMPSSSTGLLFWGWVVPAMVLVAVVGVSYLRFVFSYLPASTRNACVLGAALFVGGAIGVEMPEARHVEVHGDRNMRYALFVLVEEVFEMLGMLVLMRGLLRHLATEVGAIELQVGFAVADAAPAAVSRRREPVFARGGEPRGLGALPARFVDARDAGTDRVRANGSATAQRPPRTRVR
ncbi:MAG: hypothetical protein AB7P21_31200 [Lautropia sp.]